MCLHGNAERHRSTWALQNLPFLGSLSSVFAIPDKGMFSGREGQPELYAKPIFAEMVS